MFLINFLIKFSNKMISEVSTQLIRTGNQEKNRLGESDKFGIINVKFRILVGYSQRDTCQTIC